MILIALTGLFILRFGPRPRYIGLGILISAYGLYMAMRHSALHLARDVGQGFSIEVALDGGPYEPVEIRRLGGGYGRTSAAYTYEPPGRARLWTEGRVMSVALRGLRNHDDIVFETRFVSCR